MIIRETGDADLDAVLAVERAAFGSDDEAELVAALMRDKSAEPFLSLLAYQDDQPIGHILFTKARLAPSGSASVMLLAPLAVVPAAQGRGIGGRLIESGFAMLAERGVHLVFVLGHPGYYPRYGFVPALELDFQPTYAIAEKNVDAWMVKELSLSAAQDFRGKVLCADALNEPQYWQE